MSAATEFQTLAAGEALRWTALLERFGEAHAALCIRRRDVGTWSFVLRGGRISVAEGRSADTLLELEILSGDWADAVRLLRSGSVGPRGEGGFCGLVYLLCAARRTALLRFFSGTILARVSGAEVVLALTVGGVNPDFSRPAIRLELNQPAMASLGDGRFEDLFWSGRMGMQTSEVRFAIAFPALLRDVIDRPPEPGGDHFGGRVPEPLEHVWRSL